MGNICNYCHFECKYMGDKDICPLFAFEEDKECTDKDVDCEHYCNCDECISYREG